MRGLPYELRSGELGILALVLWRESRGESFEAKCAVAHSIINRVNHPKWWGNDIQSVIKQPYQYSSMTDPNDKQLTNWPSRSDKSWHECLQAAAAVIDRAVPNPVPGADSYFDDSIKPPYWAKDEMFVGKIGRLNFYNVDCDHEAVKNGQKS